MNIPTIAEIDQCRLKCHATRIRVEIKKSMQDPEFMKRFEDWKAANAAETARKGESS